MDTGCTSPSSSRTANPMVTAPPPTQPSNIYGHNAVAPPHYHQHGVPPVRNISHERGYYTLYISAAVPCNYWISIYVCELLFFDRLPDRILYILKGLVFLRSSRLRSQWQSWFCMVDVSFSMEIMQNLIGENDIILKALPV